MKKARATVVLWAAAYGVVTSGSAARAADPIVWTGAVSNQWQAAGDANFLDGAVPRAFAQGDAVAFTDLSMNSADVNLVGDLTIAGLTVSAARDYSLAGGGALWGSGGLTKSGTGTLTFPIDARYFFTGPVALTGGTLVLQGGRFGGGLALGNSSNDAANLFIDGGTLRYTGLAYGSARSMTVGTNGATLDGSGGGFGFLDTNDVTRPLALSGSGARTITLTGSAGGVFGFRVADAGGPTSIVKDGAGTWNIDLSGPSTGDVVVKAGRLTTVGANPGGTNVTILIQPGGSLAANSYTTQRIVVSGAGPDGQGALIRTTLTNSFSLMDVTLAGDTTVGGTQRFDHRWSLLGEARLSTTGHAYTLTKVGANQFSLVGVTVDPALGDVEVKEGTLDYEAFTTGLGDPARTLTIHPTATFMMWDATHALDKRIVSKGGTINIGHGTNNALLGAVRLDATTPVFVKINANAVVRGAVDGGAAAGLTKTGDGTLELAAANTLSGPVLVSAGRLRVTGSIASSAVTVNAGGTFEAAASQRVRGLAVNGGGSAVVTGAQGVATVLTIGDGTSAASPLVLSTGAGAAGGRVDLGAGGMIVDVAEAGRAAALVGVRDAVVSAYAGGAWSGNGVTTSAVVAGGTGVSIGYALVADLPGVVAGGTFLGSPAGPNAVVARATRAGDADLDGLVNFDDLLALAKHYNAVFGADQPGWWTRGDFNYDHVVNFDDLLLLAKNYNAVMPAAAAAAAVPGAPAAFQSDVAAAFAAAAVPEPSTGVFAVFAAAAGGRPGRRRRVARDGV